MSHKIISIIGSLFMAQAAFAYGIGQVTLPSNESRHSVGAEMLGVVNNGAGFGVQGRYMLRASNELTLDAGAGLSDGDRSNRFFLGADYMFLPDYENQPRFSFKGQLENAEEFNKRINILTFAPIVSKGFYFGGYEGYPFVSLPYSINLDGNNKTFETSIQAALGMSGKIPVEGWEQFMATIEGTLDLKDSYNSVAFGFTYLIP